jgi:hypothetical protein
MKTRGLFPRYPRKISLLKDLLRGISGASQLCKLLKTDGGLEIPSKISLLKDLADAFLGNFACLRLAAGAFQLSKNWSSLIAVYRTANVISYMLSEQKCWVKRKKGSWQSFWPLGESAGLREDVLDIEPNFIPQKGKVEIQS